MNVTATYTGRDVTELAGLILLRRTWFLPGLAPDADLPGLVDEDEADLHAMAELPASTEGWGDLRAKAAVLVGRDLAGGMSLGEAAVLRSLLADLTGGDPADPMRTQQ
jgi:hypothetical protein